MCCPFEGLRLPFEGLKQVVEVCSGIGDEPAVVADHPQKSLKFLDGCWGRCCSDGFDSVRERRDALLVHLISQEVEGIHAKDAFGPLYDQPVCGQGLEDLFQVGEMLFRRFAGDQNVVNINVHTRQIT